MLASLLLQAETVHDFLKVVPYYGGIWHLESTLEQFKGLDFAVDAMYTTREISGWEFVAHHTRGWGYVAKVTTFPAVSYLDFAEKKYTAEFPDTQDFYALFSWNPAEPMGDLTDYNGWVHLKYADGVLSVVDCVIETNPGYRVMLPKDAFGNVEEPVDVSQTWTDPTTGITWRYVLCDGGCMIGSGIKGKPAIMSGNPRTELGIPGQVAGYGVIGIAAYAFYDCTNTREIIIPKSVSQIGVGAFAGSTDADLRFEGDAPSVSEGAFGYSVRRAIAIVGTNGWPNDGTWMGLDLYMDIYRDLREWSEVYERVDENGVLWFDSWIWQESDARRAVRSGGVLKRKDERTWHGEYTSVCSEGDAVLTGCLEGFEHVEYYDLGHRAQSFYNETWRLEDAKEIVEETSEKRDCRYDKYGELREEYYVKEETAGERKSSSQKQYWHYTDRDTNGRIVGERSETIWTSEDGETESKTREQFSKTYRYDQDEFVQLIEEKIFYDANGIEHWRSASTSYRSDGAVCSVSVSEGIGRDAKVGIGAGDTHRVFADTESEALSQVAYSAMFDAPKECQGIEGLSVDEYADYYRAKAVEVEPGVWDVSYDVDAKAIELDESMKDLSAKLEEIAKGDIASVSIAAKRGLWYGIAYKENLADVWRLDRSVLAVDSTVELFAPKGGKSLFMRLVVGQKECREWDLNNK